MKIILSIALIIVTINISLCQSYQDEVFTNYFQRDGAGWNAGDGTSSIPLPDGKTLWMFGDSHANQGVDSNGEIPCLFNTRNCIMVQDESNNFTTYYDQTNPDVYSRQFIKMGGDVEVTYWPAGGFVRNNIAYSFWNRYEKDSDGPLGISFDGMVIAEINLSDFELLSVTPLSNNSLEFGMAISTDRDNGYHYIYGRKNDGIFRQAFVARCPIGEIYSNWEFFAGNNNWAVEAENMASILDDVSNEYSIFRCTDKYYLLTQERGFLQCAEGRDIYLYESENPQGPFANKKTIYTIEDKFNGEYPVTYNAQAHPQFIENNELLVSYNVNRTCPSSCANDPLNAKFDADMYRPKFARVLLSDCTLVSNDNISNKKSFKIYPNPVHHLLHLDTELFQGKTVNYIIYDQLGSIIKTGETLGSINLVDMSNGIYVMKIISDGFEQVDIIIKF